LPPEAVLSFLSHDEISHLISAYGYWVVGGVVALESIGIPVPGETALVAAAIYAATTQELNIWLVIVAAACGAIFGDNIGMAIGREIGYRLLTRYGPRIGLSERRIKLGQYLFRRHGGKVVFFGRFVAVLRALAAFLAGANCMPWRRFSSPTTPRAASSGRRYTGSPPTISARRSSMSRGRSASRPRRRRSLR
jgi:membrane protein DedA with SNARE-associated domain